MSIELTTGGRGDHRGSSQELTAVRHPEIVANEEFSSSLLTRAPQGKRILISEELEQVGIVPTGFETFSVDAAFRRFVLLEQIEGDAV